MPNLTIYLSEKEHAALKTKCTEADMSTSQYIQELIKHQTPNQMEKNVTFIKKGLEHHWKTRFPDIYIAAQSEE